MAKPNITYSSITVKKLKSGQTGSYSGMSNIPTEIQNVALSSSNCVISYDPPSNEITIQFTSDIPLNCWMARVSQDPIEPDINTGVLALFATNIEADQTQTKVLKVNGVNFPNGQGTYRISLYAQGHGDYLWDVTYIFCVLTAEGSNTWQVFKPTDTDAIEVLTNGHGNDRLAYKALKYVTSPSGNAYFTVNESTANIGRVEYDVKLPTSSSARWCIIGNGSTSVSYVGVRLFGNASLTYAGINQSRTELAASAMTKGVRITGVLTKTHLASNGTLYSLTQGATTTSTAFSILRDKDFGSTGNITVYGIRIYNTSGALIHEFTPAVSVANSTKGLLDSVTGTFYGSASGTAFQASDDALRY